MPTSNSSGTGSSVKINVTANVQAVDKANNIGEKSLKSERTYQVGVVFKDVYGRETPVFTSKKGTFTVPKAMCDKVSSITTSLNDPLPSWVDTYKFFVKETSNEYYNACMDRWYNAEDGNLWLSFPSAERNKIQEDGFIILKKEAASNNAVVEEARYKVIDIKNEAPQDIKTEYELYGSDTINVEQNGALPGSKTIKFDFDTTTNDWEGSVFYDAQKISTNLGNATGITDTGFIGWPLDSVVIKLQNAAGDNTGWLDVAGIYKDGDIFIELSKPLDGNSNDGGTISNILPDPNSGTASDRDVLVKIARKVVKNKKEFDGKFFVKISSEGAVNQRIKEVGNISANFTVTNTIDQYYLARTSGSGSAATTTAGTYWNEVGETWFIDETERGEVGSETLATNYKGPFARDNGFGILGNGSGQRQGGEGSDLRCTMELTLSRIKDGNKDGYDISNNKQINQDFLNKIKKGGTLFRWKEDPYQIVYRVTSCGDSRDLNTDQGSPSFNWKKGILNYSSESSERKAKKNKSVRLYLKFVTTGWRLNNDQANSGTYAFFEDEEGLSPFNFNNQFTPPTTTISGTPMNDWDPTKKGYGEYASATGAASYTDSTTGANWNTIKQTGNSPSTTESNNVDGYAYHNTIQILDIVVGDEEPVFTTDPAIWETEPREDVGLDIYYEASQAYPARLTDQTNELFAPYGCTVTCVDVINNKTLFLPEGTQLYDWAPTGNGGNALLLTAKANQIGIVDTTASIVSPGYLTTLTTGSYIVDGVDITSSSVDNIFFLFNDVTQLDLSGLELRFTRQDGSYTTAAIQELSAWSTGNLNMQSGHPVYQGQPNDRIKIVLNRDLAQNNIKLPYFNCYSFGNGVESDRIRDDFNQVRIGKGVKASTVPPIPYKQERRTNGLIYSGIWNSNNSINRLNQFIAAEKITKDVSPTYGSIQKLKARDTDLVTFCEDKILKIQAYKDALYSADGKPQLIASNNVLGDVSSFKGEFGISKNPESYAEDGYRMYCTDKQRGEVLRISMDGITPISNIGMDDYFGDNLKLYGKLVGTFDDRKDEYNISLVSTSRPDATVSFSEKAKGWTSFKSFIPESGVSINNNYYTFKDGMPYIHHTNQTRNNFYDVQYYSYLDLVFNEMPSVVKNFTYMNYEGTQSKIIQNTTDQEYYNNIAKDGWYVERGFTDLQEAGAMYFKEKEGKWFSYMKGAPVNQINELNSSEITFQGIGLHTDTSTDPDVDPANLVYGCTDPSALNYSIYANVDDGSCVMPVYGCTDVNATNYDPNANVDDGSCILPGNTFTITINDIQDEDNGVIEGCTNPSAVNYDPNATVDDGSCLVSSPGFLTTNPAGGPYIALTGAGTSFVGQDASAVATVPYTSSDIVFTIKTVNLTTAIIQSVLSLSAGDQLGFGDPGTGVQIGTRTIVSVQQDNWSGTVYQGLGSIHIKCSGSIPMYNNIHDSAGSANYQQVDLFWTI